MSEHPYKSRSVSLTIYHISASVLFLSVAALLIFGAVQLRESAVAASAYLTELSAMQKDSQRGITEIHDTAKGAIKSIDTYFTEISALRRESQKGISEIHETTRDAISSIDAYFRELSAQQYALREETKIAGELLNEVAAYFAARGLEEADVLSPTDANAIATEAIGNISARSLRWGTIARAFNDYILRERHRR